MIRKKNLNTLAATFCSGLALLSLGSCDNEKDIIIDEFEIVNPGNSASQPAPEKVTAKTAIIGQIGATEDLQNIFTDIVDVDKAKVILVESSMVEANAELLSQAYQRGALIAVFNPDGSVVSDWSDRNNVFYAGPESDEKCAIYSFNNQGSYYSLRDSDLIDDEEVPLFHFTNWVNKVTGSGMKVNLRTNEIKKRFTPQSITHTFKISLDPEKIREGHWGDPSQLALTTTANVTYDIYPFYVFDGNATGEYYAVEAEMVLHNAGVNNGNWTRRRGDELTQINGFFLNRCGVTAELLRKSNGTIAPSGTHAFAEGAAPMPASTADAVSYIPGFEWTIGANISGGMPDSKDNHKLTAFNNWKWTNAPEAGMPGVEIKNSGNPANVEYTLLVNGLPDFADNLASAPIPDPATGDITFKYSWIWRVADVDETSDDRFYMLVNVNPVYLAYQWMSSAGVAHNISEFENVIPQSKSAFRIPLSAPNRAATCSAVVRNSSEGSYYVRDIKLWRNKSTDNEPDFTIAQTICSPNAHGSSGVSATMIILPAGEYMVKGVRYSAADNVPFDEREIVSVKPITLTMAGNVTIDFGSDLFEVK